MKMKLWGSDDFCSGVMLTSSCSTFLNMKSAHNSHHQITKSPKSSNHIELRVLAKVMNVSNPSANSAYYAFRATCHWKAKAEDYVKIVNIIQYEDKSVDRKKALESTWKHRKDQCINAWMQCPESTASLLDFPWILFWYMWHAFWCFFFWMSSAQCLLLSKTQEPSSATTFQVLLQLLDHGIDRANFLFISLHKNLDQFCNMTFTNNVTMIDNVYKFCKIV